MPLNEISIFIQKLKSDVQHLTVKNDELFNVNSTVPQITLRRQNERHNIHSSVTSNREKFLNDDEEFVNDDEES